MFDQSGTPPRQEAAHLLTIVRALVASKVRLRPSTLQLIWESGLKSSMKVFFFTVRYGKFGVPNSVISGRNTL